MSEWKEDIFNNFIKLKRGYDLPESNIVRGKYPIVASTTIKGYHNQFKANPPGVVTGRSGSLGYVQYISTKYWPLNTTLYVKDFRDNFPKYVYYFLKKLNLENFNSGAGVPTLNQNHLHKLKIKIPPLPVQKKIAAILSAYDDLIEKNNRRIAILEKMAEEIYREWFVRLRFTGHEQVKFNKGIPEGWEVVKIDDMSEITSSKRIYADDYVKDGVPFYRSKEIIQKYNNIEISEPLYISYEKFNEINRKFGAPQKNDILITSVGTLGVCYLVKENDYFYFKDGNLIWLKKYNDTTQKYLYYWLQSEQGKSSLLETTIGTSQPAFTIVNLKKVNILKPNENILTKFINIIEPINRQNDKLLESVRNLKQTRDRLLTRLISGKLSVENLDIQFSPSMIDTE
jgi:type I restriction enzyme S subunit